MEVGRVGGLVDEGETGGVAAEDVAVERGRDSGESVIGERGLL